MRQELKETRKERDELRRKLNERMDKLSDKIDSVRDRAGTNRWILPNISIFDLWYIVVTIGVLYAVLK